MFGCSPVVFGCSNSKLDGTYLDPTGETTVEDQKARRTALDKKNAVAKEKKLLKGHVKDRAKKVKMSLTNMLAQSEEKTASRKKQMEEWQKRGESAVTKKKNASKMGKF